MPAECCKKFYEKIPDDEPVFTIAGRDLLGPDVIRCWIGRAADNGVNADKLQRAVQHLKWFEEFQAAHPERCHLPD